MYPEDFGFKVGDVALFKVEVVKHLGDGSPSFRVLEFSCSYGVVDVFFEKFHSSVLSKVSLFGWLVCFFFFYGLLGFWIVSGLYMCVLLALYTLYFILNLYYAASLPECLQR